MESEYELSAGGCGLPRCPPCDVGYIQDGAWKPIDEPYHLEVSCNVRIRIVRFYTLESEDDLDRPPDFSSYRPRFDEDCMADERDGIFVHPEAGAMRIAPRVRYLLDHVQIW